MSDENNWREISNQQKLEQLLDLTLGFHDAITVSSKWQGAEFINESGGLELHGRGTLVLVIASQFPQVPAFGLKFEKVKQFRYEYGSDLEPYIAFTKLGVLANLLEWQIEAASLEYRVLEHPSIGESEQD